MNVILTPIRIKTMKKGMPAWHREIQKAIAGIGILHQLTTKDIAVFLTATLSGQFALAGYSEEFVKKTLDRMFEQYLEIKERISNDSTA